MPNQIIPKPCYSQKSVYWSFIWLVIIIIVFTLESEFENSFSVKGTKQIHSFTVIITVIVFCYLQISLNMALVVFTSRSSTDSTAAALLSMR